MRWALVCLVVASTSFVAPRQPPSPANPMTWTALRPSDTATDHAASVDTAGPSLQPDIDSQALDEMLRGSKGRRERWTHVPELVVLTSVMQFQTAAANTYLATDNTLSDDDLAGLVSDLTNALAMLTGNTVAAFASIRFESVSPGVSAPVIRPDQIVVGRYRGVRQRLEILGLGGRAVRADGSITGAAVILDDDYDREGALRTRLRTHELAHALGYNHVHSRESIMNPRIGPDATDFDRRAVAIAFPAGDARN
jgi:hypothetical protein